MEKRIYMLLDLFSCSFWIVNSNHNYVACKCSLNWQIMRHEQQHCVWFDFWRRKDRSGIACVCVCMRAHACVCVCVCARKQLTKLSVSTLILFIPKSASDENKALRSGHSMNRAETKTTQSNESWPSRLKSRQFPVLWHEADHNWNLS